MVHYILCTMITNTGDRIVEFIRENGRARVSDLVEYLGLGNVAIHRQLKRLMENGVLIKVGTPPKVFYLPAERLEKPERKRTGSAEKLVEKTYLYVTPAGEMLLGTAGFAVWAKKAKREAGAAAAEYVRARKQADKFIGKSGWIDATEKIQKTFQDDTFANKVLYKDFYALPVFGKTRLGQLVLHGKQAQSKEIVKQIAGECQGLIKKIIRRFGIEAVGFLPHSIPRRIQFLKELRKQLKLNLPEVELVKAYAGKIPVAQKSLASLEERVENARSTIMIGDIKRRFASILLIDDAVGSGATLNETARKLKIAGIAKKVTGFAIVGSMKGFEVIREI